MRVALTVLCLFGLALGGVREGLSDDDTAMVNKMMDVLDSGLNADAGVDEKGRALFISLTLTSTSTNLATATVTTTETASCVANAAGGTSFTDCAAAAATTARSLSIGRNGDFIVDHIIQMSDENMDNEFMAVAEEFDEFEGEITVHKVYNGKSQKASISDILPTRTQSKGLKADFVVNADETSELQSGSISWSEASVDKAHSACGRSGLEGENKRARILALANEVVTKSLTSTSTITETAANTVTFSVQVACTNAGFMFQHPMCS